MLLALKLPGELASREAGVSAEALVLLVFVVIDDHDAVPPASEVPAKDAAEEAAQEEE